jgi:hypothetical protein
MFQLEFLLDDALTFRDEGNVFLCQCKTPWMVTHLSGIFVIEPIVHPT